MRELEVLFSARISASCLQGAHTLGLAGIQGAGLVDTPRPLTSRFHDRHTTDPEDSYLAKMVE